MELNNKQINHFKVKNIDANLVEEMIKSLPEELQENCFKFINGELATTVKVGDKKTFKIKNYGKDGRFCPIEFEFEVVKINLILDRVILKRKCKDRDIYYDIDVDDYLDDDDDFTVESY